MTNAADIAAARHDVHRAAEAVTIAEAKVAERRAALAHAEAQLAELLDTVD